MRLELTQRSDLGLQALHVIARSPQQIVSGPEIASAINVSAPYLGTIMGPLVRAGWVRSFTGPTGGYRLTAMLSERSVLDLVEAMEGEVDRDSCMHSDPMQEVNEPCALHDPWTRARNALLDTLAKTMLTDVLELDETTDPPI
ncbi:MAG: Rrf2 family transcriptional regulator [Actinomycetota bacterium]